MTFARNSVGLALPVMGGLMAVDRVEAEGDARGSRWHSILVGTGRVDFTGCCLRECGWVELDG